jgi:CRISPR system Cascade subunit CasE
MYFSQVTLLSLDKIAENPNHLTWVSGDNGYFHHQLLWTFFPGKAEGSVSPFRFRREQAIQPLGFLVVSEEEPRELPGWQILAKPYNPQIEFGMLLGFKLLANPVVAKKDPNSPESDKRFRHDVVMNEKGRLKEKKMGLPPIYDIARMAGLAWLKERAEKNGFQFDDDLVRIDQYRQHRFGKGKHDQSEAKNQIKISTLEFSGVLRVVDPAKFKDALIKGVGPAKGFGCGLLVVRKIS